MPVVIVIPSLTTKSRIEEDTKDVKLSKAGGVSRLHMKQVHAHRKKLFRTCCRVDWVKMGEGTGSRIRMMFATCRNRARGYVLSSSILFGRWVVIPMQNLRQRSWQWKRIPRNCSVDGTTIKRTMFQHPTPSRLSTTFLILWQLRKGTALPNICRQEEWALYFLSYAVITSRIIMSATTTLWRMSC